MKTTVLTFAAALVAAGGIALAGPASAAHCLAPAGSDPAPGFSWFGVHARATTDAEGGNPGPHQGTSGASNCLETTGNPSERAPGRG
ncbi:hypothetical protein [Aquipuribacter nitratireducens]|uniref:Uncharacterized protein n=1 Tax=Aquipuribacter nitratireducens TaxID=650104 RepID=A0ABW0GKK6_9MICO